MFVGHREEKAECVITTHGHTDAAKHDRAGLTYESLSCPTVSSEQRDLES